jgi:hypothetical protein
MELPRPEMDAKIKYVFPFFGPIKEIHHPVNISPYISTIYTDLKDDR